MNQYTVGILLPPSVGGALVNLAATLSGRTVVNLNYTVGANWHRVDDEASRPRNDRDESRVF